MLLKIYKQIAMAETWNNKIYLNTKEVRIKRKEGSEEKSQEAKIKTNK